MPQMKYNYIKNCLWHMLIILRGCLLCLEEMKQGQWDSEDKQEEALADAEGLVIVQKLILFLD